MTKYLLIINPKAARGKAEKTIPQIEENLKGLGLDYDLVKTERVGHAIELAEKACEGGYDVIVAGGGDGTINEVINGMMTAIEKKPNHVMLGVLPIGRGNDFSFGMNIPQDLTEACALIASKAGKPIDIGLVKGEYYPDGRYFGNGVGIGFDTIVGFESAKLPAFLSGVPAYLIAAVKTIFLYNKSPHLTFTSETETWEQTGLMVSIMNGRRLGGSFMMTPDAESDDGLLSLCICPHLRRREIIKLFPKYMAGTQSEDERIKTLKTKTLKIKALEGVLPVHADGETISVTGKDLEVQLIKQAIHLICKC